MANCRFRVRKVDSLTAGVIHLPAGIALDPYYRGFQSAESMKNALSRFISEFPDMKFAMSVVLNVSIIRGLYDMKVRLVPATLSVDEIQAMLVPFDENTYHFVIINMDLVTDAMRVSENEQL